MARILCRNGVASGKAIFQLEIINGNAGTEACVPSYPVTNTGGAKTQIQMQALRPANNNFPA
jgi:hypothetical protein